jgi:hypothetical protein
MSNYFEDSSAIDNWLMKRRSRFTSSENFKLLRGDKQNKDDVWSAGSISYIETKVIELTTAVYERPKLEEVEALRHGKANEFPSFERYIAETRNYSMTYLGDETPTFIPCKVIVGESGGTPDVANIIVGSTDDNVSIDHGAELKNPVNPAYHFRRLHWKTQWDVKEGYIQCYTQIQDLMRITGAKEWDFVSHDERQLVKSKQIKIIPIKRDEKFINNLEIRIMMAVKEKYKMLSKHFGTIVSNREDFNKLVHS